MGTISKPDYEDIGGLLITTDDSVDISMPFDLTRLGKYMRKHNKNYDQLTLEELKLFLIDGYNLPDSLDELWIYNKDQD